MVEEPDIIKQLREAEKNKGLKSNTNQGIYQMNQVQERCEESDVKEYSIAGINDTDQPKNDIKNEEQNLYHSVVELSPDGIVVLDLKGVVLSCNVSAEKFLGYSKKELIGKKFSEIELYTNQDFAQYCTKFSSSIQGERVEPFEMNITRKDKTMLTVEARLGLLTRNGKKVGLQVIFRDLYHQKKTEGELTHQKNLLEAIIDGIPDVLAIQYPDHSIERYNKTGYALLNKTYDEVKGKKCYELIGRDHECDQCASRIALKSKKLEQLEKYVPEMNVFLECRSNPILDKNGNVVQIVEQLRDITEEKHQEKKIKESREQFKSLFFDSPVSIIVHDKDTGEIIDANKKAYTAYGFSSVDELKDYDFWLDPPYSFNDALTWIKKADQEGPQQFEWINRKKNGELFWEQVRLSSATINGIKRILATSVDITDRKNAEESLKKSEGRLSTILSNTPAVIYSYKIIDGIPEITYVNENVKQVLGFEPEDFLNNFNRFKECLHPEDTQKVFSAMATLMREGKVTLHEYRFKDKWGNYRWLNDEQKLITHEDGTLEVIGAWWDITDRKQAEEKLRESEQFLQTTFDSVQDGISVLDTDLDIMSVNKTMEKLYPEMLPLQGKKCYEVYQGRSEPCKLCPSLRALKTGKLERDDVPLIIEGKAVGFLEVYAFPILDDTGKATGVVEYVRDVTDRKQAEDALKEKNLFIEKIMSSLPNTVVYIFDLLTHKNVYASDNLANVLGYTAEEFQAMGEMVLKKLIHPDDLEPFIEYLKVLKTLNEDDVRTIAYRMKHRNGHWVWIENRDTVFTFDESGRPLQTIGSAADITKRKQAELALRRSEERYRNYFEQSYDAIMTLAPPSWNFTSGNPATIKMFGAKKADEFIGQGPWDLSPEYQPDGQLSSEKAKEMIETAMRKGSHFFEWVHTRLDGTEFQTTVLLSKMQTSEEEYLQAVVRDITELKQTERKLEEEQKRLEHILNITGTGINITDAECNLQYVDNGWQKIYGDPSGRKCYEYFMGLSEPCQGCGIPNALETKEVSVSEEILPKEGNRLVEVHTIPFQNSSGQWLVAEFNIDITERKKIEKEMERQVNTIQLLNQIISKGYSAKDTLSYLQETLTVLLSTLEYDAGSVALLDPDGKNSSVVCSKHIPEPFLDRMKKISIDDNPIYIKVFRENETIIVDDFANIDPVLAKILGYNSFIISPIVSDKMVIGALYLASSDLHVFTESDNILMKSITSQIGTIIDSFKSEEILIEKLNELEHWKKVTVGRELKMKELKKKIKELKERCQQ